MLEEKIRQIAERLSLSRTAIEAVRSILTSKEILNYEGSICEIDYIFTKRIFVTDYPMVIHTLPSGTKDMEITVYEDPYEGVDAQLTKAKHMVECEYKMLPMGAAGCKCE